MKILIMKEIIMYLYTMKTRSKAVFHNQPVVPNGSSIVDTVQFKLYIKIP